ncbi:hypothetical protein AVEN_138393-1, partial [Araneus ventricosus]
MRIQGLGYLILAYMRLCYGVYNAVLFTGSSEVFKNTAPQALHGNVSSSESEDR